MEKKRDKRKFGEEEENAKIKGTILHQVLENYFRAKLGQPHDLFESEKARDFILHELDKAFLQFPLMHEKKYQLDLDYEEDSAAAADLNVVMTDDGRFVEINGGGEAEPLSQQQLDALLTLARRGIEQLIAAQKKALLR